MNERALSIGDEIMVPVQFDGYTKCVRGVVHTVGPFGVFAAGVGVALHVCDEGRVWIRGYHDVGSEEAQALLAAYALTR